MEKGEMGFLEYNIYLTRGWGKGDVSYISNFILSFFLDAMSERCEILNYSFFYFCNTSNCIKAFQNCCFIKGGVYNT